MTTDYESTVTLVNCRNSFEADTILQALLARGINAQAIDAANANIWLGMNNLSQAKIVVLAHDEARARQALEDIKSEVSEIDWSQIDVGDESEGARMTEAARTKRWMWTLLVVLVPIGFFVLAFGMQRGDRMIQLIGGVLLATSIALGFSIMAPDAKGGGPDEDTTADSDATSFKISDRQDTHRP